MQKNILCFFRAALGDFYLSFPLFYTLRNTYKKEKLDELTANWTAQEYARNRKNDYPDWRDQLNKIYDDGVDKWKTEMVDPVKAKWPKDNSGPK